MANIISAQIQEELQKKLKEVVNNTVKSIVEQYKKNIEIKIQEDVQKLVEKKEEDFKQRLELIKKSNPSITLSIQNLVKFAKQDILTQCQNETIKIEEKNKLKNKDGSEKPPTFKQNEVDDQSKKNKNVINQGGDVQSSQNINIRLTWNVSNDLDLHCMCPCGAEIFYQRKKCDNCKTFLDRDMTGGNPPLIEHMHLANAENSFKLKPGTYTYWVVYYRADSNTSYELSFQTNGQYYFREEGSQNEVTHISSKSIQNQSQSRQFKFTISEQQIIAVPEQAKPLNNTDLQDDLADFMKEMEENRKNRKNRKNKQN